MAQVLAAIGCNVQFNDVLAIDSEVTHGAVSKSLESLLSSSDILTIHVDGRASNRHRIGAAELSLMKPDGMLINTARGFVLDAAALADRLRVCPRMTAVLDVHDPEPPRADNPLVGVPNAVLLPHAASRTESAQQAMSWVVRQVMAVISG